MDCQYEPIGSGKLRCRQCGDIATRQTNRNCIMPTYGPHRPGLGDHIAVGLTMLGVTKERYAAWLGKPCNCQKRQEKLNRLGRYITKRAERLAIQLPF